MDVSVGIATYGHESWRALGDRRAFRSVKDMGVPIIRVHGETLHDARNECVRRCETEYLSMLDADDQLEPGFFEAIGRCSRADMIVPSVRYVRHSMLNAPAYIPRVPGHEHDCVARCLLDGNFCVIGTVVKTDVIWRAGGWRDWPAYEDFDLFQRCFLAGASLSRCPTAVYRAYKRHRSRNSTLTPDESRQLHSDICVANGLPPLEAS